MRAASGFKFWIFKRARAKGKFFLQWEEHKAGKIRKRQATYGSKGDAQKEADRLAEEHQRNHGLSADVRFDAFASAWLTRYRPMWASTTTATHEWALKHILAWVGTRQVRELRPGAIKDFLLGKVASNELKRQSVSLIRRTLHHILEEARATDRIIAENPAHFTGTRRLKLTPTRDERRQRIKALRMEQVAAFLRAAPSVYRSYALLFRTMVSTGLRLGEALGLEWDAVEWDSSTLYIHRQVVKRQERDKTKTKATRTVDVPVDLMQALRSWHVEQQAAALKSGRAPRWVFPSRAGTHLDYSRTNEAFHKMTKAAAIAGHFTPYDLRHTFATLALQTVKTIDGIDWVQNQLGHATRSMTLDYYGAWLPKQRQPENANAFEAAITGKPEPAALPEGKRAAE